MINVLGDISGSQINPIFTYALLIEKRTAKKETVFYVSAQIIGAFEASGFLKFMFAQNPTLVATIPSSELFQFFILEFILTFFLMLTILGVISKRIFQYYRTHNLTAIYSNYSICRFHFWRFI